MKELLGECVWSVLAGAWTRLLGLDPVVLEVLLNSGLALFAYLVLRVLLYRLTGRRIQDASLRYTIRKTTSYVLGGLLILTVAKIWLRGHVDMSTFLGLATAGLAIALQDPIINLAGWLFLLVRQPFRVGDRIQIGQGPAGDVVDMRLFSFLLLEIGNWVEADQSTGRIIYIPNGTVFKQPFATYTQGFRYVWHEVPVNITLDSHWQRAKSLLEDGSRARR